MGETIRSEIGQSTIVKVTVVSVLAAGNLVARDVSYTDGPSVKSIHAMVGALVADKVAVWLNAVKQVPGVVAVHVMEQDPTRRIVFVDEHVTELYEGLADAADLDPAGDDADVRAMHGAAVPNPAPGFVERYRRAS